MVLTAHNDQHQAEAAPAGLILASASPRRRELLAYLGATYRAVATDAEDRDDPAPAHVIAALPPLDLPLPNHPTLLAWRKAHAVSLLAFDESQAAQKAEGKRQEVGQPAPKAQRAPATVVLGADTIVVLDGAVLNKPRDAEHAQMMLAQLSGRTHTVYTGLCVIGGQGDQGTSSAFGPQPSAFALTVVASQVEVAPLSAEEIAAYVATGEPLDKAGAYGIQGLGGRLVRAVYGSYTNVVGLPLTQVCQLLTAAGVAGLRPPDESYQHWLESQGKEPLPCPPTLP